MRPSLMRHQPRTGIACESRSTRPAGLVVGPPPENAVVEMVGVTKWYGRGGGGRLALDGLDLVVPSGGVFGVLGRNGAGKTTALRCLLGLVRPTSGVCRVLGADCSSDLHRVISRIGALIETPGLAPSLTGRRNLALLARLDRIGADGVERALRAAGLAERGDDPVATYSLGMRQRLGIAAALLRDPEVVVLDEPANGLDPAGIADIRRLLVSLAAQGRTVVVSSHLLDEAEKMCDRVAVIEAGRCVAVGPIGDLLASAGAGGVLVGVADVGAARLALVAAGLNVTIVDGRLRVSCPPGDAARVTELLAAKRLFVNELRYDTPTLEDFFFRLTARLGAGALP
ncbi:MAG: ABC transporter ATP-binding protein [Acidimicrobiales bacterium]